MCLSMIGLITFQWYWIKEALAAQNDRFNDKVAEAVQNVAHKLEKQEIVYLLQQRREDEIQKEKLRQMTILARTKENRPERKDTVVLLAPRIPGRIGEEGRSRFPIVTADFSPTPWYRRSIN